MTLLNVSDEYLLVVPLSAANLGGGFLIRVGKSVFQAATGSVPTFSFDFRGLSMPRDVLCGRHLFGDLPGTPILLFRGLGEEDS